MVLRRVAALRGFSCRPEIIPRIELLGSGREYFPYLSRYNQPSIRVYVYLRNAKLYRFLRTESSFLVIFYGFL